MWECAAGSGQATAQLRARFDRVVATDRSHEQLRNLPAVEGIDRLVADALAAPLGGRTVDAVVVAQAIHWFHGDSFWREVARVCRPPATLFFWSYGLATATAAIDAVVHDFHRRIVGSYWPSARRHVDTGLTDIQAPFAELATPDLDMSVDWTLAQLLGYVGTWSAVKRYRAASERDPLVELEPRLERAWGDAASRRVRWPLTIRAGRVE